MSQNRESTGGLLGLLGVAMLVCCGLPILLAGGIAIGAAGLALGSGVFVAAGIALAGWGWRHRHNAQRCDLPASDRDRASAPSDTTQR
jgi:hypothetical protein